MPTKLITLTEAGRRLARDPEKPLSPQRVRQLAGAAGIRLRVFAHPTDRRVRTGITPQAVAALKKRRNAA